MSATGYHGDRTGSAVLAGMLWVATDREYAEGYAGEYGRVVDVDLSGLEVLDLTGVSEWDCGCLMVDEGALRDALDDAGVESATYRTDEEMHMRIPQLSSALRAAGYDAVRIREWTDGVGETESICILNHQ